MRITAILLALLLLFVAGCSTFSPNQEYIYKDGTATTIGAIVGGAGAGAAAALLNSTPAGIGLAILAGAVGGGIIGNFFEKPIDYTQDVNHINAALDWLPDNKCERWVSPTGVAFEVQVNRTHNHPCSPKKEVRISVYKDGKKKSAWVTFVRDCNTKQWLMVENSDKFRQILRG